VTCDRVGIATLDELREHLQWAIEVEHTTIPSYLCALYSLDAERNAAAVEVLHSVVLEEMLHLALAANLLNAVGGRPELDSPRLLPAYPRRLPHRDPPLDIPLLPFGPDALEVFLNIEHPCTADAPAQGDGYETIGQFYDAIRLGLLTLSDQLGEHVVFCGDASRQLADEEFRDGPGRIFAITGLDTALAALALIVEQGEGVAHSQVWDGDRDMFHAERDAVGHYYRFLQLRVGRRFQRGDTPQSGPTGDAIEIDWDAVRPMRPDPRSTDHPPGSAVRVATDRFNAVYCTVLQLLEQTVNGRPEQLGPAISTMFRLRGHAEALMQLPSASGVGSAGPSFEYVPPEHRAAP
jgi:hypothetical protein